MGGGNGPVAGRASPPRPSPLHPLPRPSSLLQRRQPRHEVRTRPRRARAKAPTVAAVVVVDGRRLLSRRAPRSTSPRSRTRRERLRVGGCHRSAKAGGQHRAGRRSFSRRARAPRVVRRGRRPKNRWSIAPSFAVPRVRCARSRGRREQRGAADPGDERARNRPDPSMSTMRAWPGRRGLVWRPTGRAPRLCQREIPRDRLSDRLSTH